MEAVIHDFQTEVEGVTQQALRRHENLIDHVVPPRLAPLGDCPGFPGIVTFQFQLILVVLLILMIFCVLVPLGPRN